MNDQERKLLHDYLLGNADAARLCEDLYAVFHFWDDAIDCDVEISADDINRNMWKLMFDIPANPFYAANRARIDAVLKMAVASWHNATLWEREPGACLEKLAGAFVLRSQYQELFVVCAMIIGGDEYGIRTAPLVREMFHTEGFRGFLKGIQTERKIREGVNNV